MTISQQGPIEPASSRSLERENLVLREELKRSRLELRRADQVKRDFIALTADELRSPLAILLGYAKILETEVTGVAQGRAEIIAAQASRLQNILNAMVTLQQIESGDLRLRQETVPVAGLVREAVDAHKRELQDKRLTVEIAVEPGLTAHIDRDRIALAFASLLSNSIRYSPQGSSIAVQARPEPSFVLVSIRDHGIDIPQTDWPLVFDRCYRANQQLSRCNRGTALSLALAKGLIELHGGRIWLESASGQGNTFSLTLPRENPPSLPSRSHNIAGAAPPA